MAVSGLSGVSAVSAGGQHALALLDNGTAMSWGDNETDQLGDGQDVSTQSNSAVPVAVAGLTGAVAVAAGFQHSLALLGSGAVMAWGDNGFFQLAQRQGFPSGIADSDVPLAVPGIAHATAIAAGGFYSLALSNMGTVMAWGDNAVGQLGNSSTATRQAVVKVKGLTGVTAIAAGGAQSLALVPAAAGSSGLPAVSGPPSSPWRVVPAQNSPAMPGGLSGVTLNSVSAASATDAWAVGSSPTATEPIGEHWNGKAWTIVPSAPGPVAPSILTGVDDLGPTNAWAVGSSGGVGSERTLIEHWDGTSWSVVPSPNPETGPGEFDELQAVSGSNPDDLWAVGTFSISQGGGTLSALLLLQWNGTTWTFFAPPDEGTDLGTAVTVISADDAWVVGDDLGGTVSAHFNGTSWSDVATPILNVKDSVNDLTGITNAGADDVWASGFEDGGSRNFRNPYLLHWTGTAWKLVEVPDAGSEGSQLSGVTAISPTNVWVTGVTAETDGGLLALSEQFNGKSWSIMPTLDPGQLASLPDSTFQAIATTGTGTLLAVGSEELPGHVGGLPLAEEITGTG